jgi:hypothetical protein
LYAFRSDIATLWVPSRPVISSDVGGSTWKNPFRVFIDFFQVASNLTPSDILVTNGILEKLELILSLPNNTIYHATISPEEQGIVSLQVVANTVDEGNFASYDFSVNFTGGTGTRGLNGIDQLTIYPNPTTGKIRVSSPMLEEQEATVGIYTVTGKALILEKLSPGTRELELDLGLLAHGVYLLRLTSTSGSETRKVILQDY